MRTLSHSEGSPLVGVALVVPILVGWLSPSQEELRTGDEEEEEEVLDFCQKAVSPS